MTKVIDRCPRCSGDLFVDFDEIECVQCSYSLSTKVTREDKKEIVKVFRWRNSETLTGKVLQKVS